MKIYKLNFKISNHWLLIILFAVTKVLIHFFTVHNFELHRDAYLYYAQSEHLSWGYVAVPPSIAFVGKIATFIFGNTTFGLRFFPAIIGGVNLIIIGLAVKELKGKTIAIILACLAYLLSPAYLHTNALFQPVCFDHFYWLLSCYLILLLVNRNDAKIWLWIGVVFGLAFLNKYSILFLIAAFSVALAVSRYRKLYTSKYFFIGLGIGLIIILPNLIWQYQNNWPVLMHMAELRETQLVHVQQSAYIIDQFMMNMQAVALWVVAVIVILLNKKESQFRIFGIIFLIVVILIMMGSGKSYYTLGIYPILFVFGAYLTEKYIKKYAIHIAGFLVSFMLVSLYISFSFDGIPFITFEKAIKEDAYRWEDGKYYDISQDMADMTGWKAIGTEVKNVYVELGEENRDNCDIFCYHYGQAGAVMFYGKDINIPQPISYNGSFVFWAPDSLTKDYLIWVHSDLGNDIKPDSLLPGLFSEVELKTVIDDNYFRENGTRIYLCKGLTSSTKEKYINRINEEKGVYRRK